jgi:hypothetical protein
MSRIEFQRRFAGSFTQAEQAFLWNNEEFEAALKSFKNETLEELQTIERIGVALILKRNKPPIQ